MARYIAAMKVNPMGRGNSYQQVFYERDDLIVEKTEQLYNRPGSPIGAGLDALAHKYFDLWLAEMDALGNTQTDNNGITVADAWIGDDGQIVTVPPGQ